MGSSRGWNKTVVTGRGWSNRTKGRTVLMKNERARDKERERERETSREREMEEGIKLNINKYICSRPNLSKKKKKVEEIEYA